jgi:glycosyltransferase involved in cell wall biosynthesis
MNIVFFMQDTGAIYGAERATIDLAVGLREAGDTPAIFLIEEARLEGRTSALRLALAAEGLPIESFRIEGRISRTLARSVREAFVRVNGDVLHVIGYKANLHAWLSGIHPVVATVHGWLFRDDLKERMYDAIDRWCLRRCDHVICLSTYYKKLLVKKGVSPSRLSRIPSGLRELPSDDEVASSQRMLPPVTFGMMGRFSEEKNHPMFLAAAKLVLARYPDTRFRIAGNGPMEEMLRRLVTESGLSHAVTFCGYCDVASFMPSIDVYVMCSKIENLPYSILEAMAWARPVIGTRVGGVPDLIEDQASGYLVEPGDADALARAMTALVEDPALIHTMGACGREHVRSTFSLTQSVEQHQQVYRQAGRRHA